MNACELQSNILGELLPNLRPQQPDNHLNELIGAMKAQARGPVAPALPKKTVATFRRGSDYEMRKPSFPSGGRGRGNGRKKFSERGDQVGPSAFLEGAKINIAVETNKHIKGPKIGEEKENEKVGKAIEKKLERKTPEQVLDENAKEVAKNTEKKIGEMKTRVRKTPEKVREESAEEVSKKINEIEEIKNRVRKTPEKVPDEIAEEVTKKIEEIKIPEKEPRVHSTRYNLRGSSSGGGQHENEAESVADKSEEEVFKKPDLANLTIAAHLLPHLTSAGKTSSLPLPNIAQCVADIRPSVTISSPVAGGNLKAKKKTIVDTMPCSPPSSTSTCNSVDMSAKLREISDTPKDADCNSSILKPNRGSVEILEGYEDTGSSKHMRPYAGKQEVFKSTDADFLPICLAIGQEYLFVTSQSTNQVQVFRDETQQGVLKLNDSKYFTSVRNVHTIIRSNEISQVVVLDNEGFHFFVENGLFIRTVLSGEGFKHRGLGHIYYEGRLCLVSLDVNERRNGGTEVVLIDVDSKSETCNDIIKRLKITGTNDIPDVQSKCRFLAVTPDEKKVYVTSMLLNKIYSVDLKNGECKTFNHEIKEPAGIAIDPKVGTVFVSSRGDAGIEAFDSDLGYLGRFLTLEAKPIGLCVHKGPSTNDVDLYMATNATTKVNNAIIKAPIKYK